MIGIDARKIAYIQNEIDDLGWLRRNGKIADGFTKFDSGNPLDIMFGVAVFKQKLLQWII